MNHRDFYHRIAVALTGCQLVEQELKLYITEAFELVRKRLDGSLSFSMSGDDYENSSLESLIKVFRKLSDNPTLVKELDKFKDERNFLSHKGITYCLDLDGDLDIQAMEEIDSRLSAIAPTASKLCMEINEEANKFRGHLWLN